MRRDRSRKHTLRLGIFVAVGTLLFIIAIYLLGKEQNLFGTTFTVSCGVKDVSGLMVGNNVRFSGINVGTVDNIVILSDTLVRIDMIIESDVKKFIKKDSKAVIGAEGLMGNKLVSILPGSPASPVIEDGDMIASAKPIDINEVMTSLQKTGDNIEHITTDLAKVMHKVSHGEGTVGKILTDSAFAETIHKSLLNIERGTAGFSENMEALKGNILLRGYYKKKDKEQKDREEEEEESKRDRKNKKDK